MSAAAEDLLDDAAGLEAADPSGILRAVASAAAQVREAAHLAAEAGVGVLADEAPPRAVLVTGGASAVLTGHLLTALVGAGAGAPVVVQASGALPLWAGAADLVLVGSRHGTSPQALRVLADAGRRGCRTVLAAPSGSAAAELALRHRAIVVPVPHDRPAGTSLWSVATPLLAAAAGTGLAVGTPEDAAAALEAAAARCRVDADALLNPAKTLAASLAGRAVLVLGTSEVTGAAARRLAWQLGRTGGVPAWGATLTEGSLEQASGILRGEVPCHLVLLRDPAGGEEVPADALLDGARGAVSELLAEEGPAWARAASLIGLGDFAAVYLALLQGRDPGRE